MKTSILAYRFIRNRPLIFILISCMLAISLISINAFIGQLYASTYSYRIISRLNDTNYVYFQPEDQQRMASYGENNSSADIQEIMTTYERTQMAVNKTVGAQRITYVNQLSFSTECSDIEQAARYGSAYLTAYLIDDFIASKLQLPLDKGKWYSESASDGCIDIVISRDCNTLEVGDVFEVEIKPESYMKDLMAGLNPEPIYINLRVSGILAEPVLELTYSISSSSMYSVDLLKEHKITEYPLIYLSENALYECIIRETDIISKQPHSIVIYDNNLTDAQNEENVRILSDYGRVMTKGALKEGTDSLIKSRMYKQIPTAVFILLIGIIGLISMTVMNTFQYKKHFSIFFICGCKWKQCILINLMYILYSFVFAVLILIGYIQISARMGHDSFEIYSVYNVIATAVICLIVVGLTAIVPYFLMARQTPKEILTDESE